LFESNLACKNENPFEFRVRVRLRLYWGLQPIVFAVPNGPVLDAQSELDVHTGIFVSGAYFRPENDERLRAPLRCVSVPSMR
jgi:hypothetical protein